MLQRDHSTESARTVTCLPSDPGPAGWNAILPERASFAPLESGIHVDVLVIGAGFAGLAAARRLSQLVPPGDIALLEARAVADGPVGRNTGFMIDLPHHLASSDYAGVADADRRQTEMNRAAISFAANAVAEYELPEETFRKVGKINAAATAKGTQHNRDYAAHLSSMAEPHELLDAQQMREISGSAYYQSGLFSPGTAMLQPALYARGMANGLHNAGVRIYEHTPIVQMSSDSSGCWQAKSPNGCVHANKIILCVNGHAESFGFFSRRLMHIYLYASMTAPLSKAEVVQLGGEPNWGFTPSDPHGTTVRRISGTTGDRIVVRNRFTWSPARCVDDSVLSSFARSHDRSFADRFPGLADVRMDYRWGGLLCLSRNSAPAFGEIAPNVFSACCQNGLGAAAGTLHGMLAADLAVGVPNDMASEIMTKPAPSRLPPEPFASIGANAVMRWGEFRAGREL